MMAASRARYRHVRAVEPASDGRLQADHPLARHEEAGGSNRARRRADPFSRVWTLLSTCFRCSLPTCESACISAKRQEGQL